MILLLVAALGDGRSRVVDRERQNLELGRGGRPSRPDSFCVEVNGMPWFAARGDWSVGATARTVVGTLQYVKP